jgi:hypothetical protein
MKGLEILREMVFYITCDIIGLKSFCFSGLEMLALYFGELSLVSLCLTHTKLHAYI